MGDFEPLPVDELLDGPALAMSAQADPAPAADDVPGLAYDFDGDGAVDYFIVDQDGDGFTETVAVDADEDGTFESVALDTDLDGVVDTTGVDTDGDGVLDTTYEDTDGDGEDDTETPLSATDTTFDVSYDD